MNSLLLTSLILCLLFLNILYLGMRQEEGQLPFSKLSFCISCVFPNLKHGSMGFNTCPRKTFSQTGFIWHMPFVSMPHAKVPFFLFLLCPGLCHLQLFSSLRVMGSRMLGSGCPCHTPVFK